MRRLVVGEEVVAWVAQQTNEYGDFGAATGIGVIEKQGEKWNLIAGIAYAEWNGVNVVCHIASDLSRRWLTKQFLWMIFDYPFEQLKVKRMTACIGEGNKDSRRFVEHLGFTLECRLSDAHPTGDILVYAMRKPQAERWLKLKDSHEDILENSLRVAA